MLPKLSSPRPESRYREFTVELARLGFAGDIQTDYASRNLQSTDNSIYQIVPQGVLYPADTEDLLRLTRLSQKSAYRDIRFYPRGGGTGTNGQALGNGLVVDMSRHMNRILEINEAEGWARVQPGVVKDQLNHAVESAGLFFAPDLSTSNRATIGGMVNTDASGQGSCHYGKTRHHVLELECVLADGSYWRSRPLDEAELTSVADDGSRVGELYRLADAIHRQRGELIDRYFPPLNRSLTGYDLAHLRDAQGRLDLNSLLCGSEGTLGFVSEITVNLEPLPRHRALAVLPYEDFVAALRDARRLIQAAPTAIETVDERVLALARGDASWWQLGEHIPNLPSGQRAGALNLVELSGITQEELEAAVQQLQALPDNGLGWKLLRDKDAVDRVWTMRKKAVGLLGKQAGRAFVEDTAVPPENLADYIEAFRQLLDAEGLQYGMFGHADAGVIHVRPSLDMRDPDSMSTVRRLSDAVFQLTRRYGGLLWGEHGKGLRSEYSPATFGPLYRDLQRIKACADPHNQLNPGKLATPTDDGQLIALHRASTRGERDRVISRAIWDEYSEATICNGNGACFNWNPADAMCPSYKATGERKYSPKGRAQLMKEWLARTEENGADSSRGGALEPSRTLPGRRLWAALTARLGRDDFSREVYDSMDQCLACKACATGCPLQVDVPAFRSSFFSHYFRRYPRPLRHYLIAALESLLPRAATLPAIYNGLTRNRAGQWLADRLLGLTALPALSRPTLDQRMRELGVVQAERETLANLPETEKARSVVLVVDVFSRYFDAAVVADICRFLQKLGCRPWLAPFIPHGKPLEVLGFLPRFRQTARQGAEKLRQLSDTGIPLVGIDPSMTLSYRSDYPKVLPEEEVPAVHLLQEWLSQQTERLQRCRTEFTPGPFRLFPHCTEEALAAPSLEAWRRVFESLGSKLTVARVGCCGMAGTYGHESAHRRSSTRLYDLSWKGQLDEQTVATGYSCRSQVHRFGDPVPPHPVQALLRRL